MASDPTIGIFGAGAIGGYLGVRLAAGGARVRMLGRGDLVTAAPRLQAADLGKPFVGGGDLEIAGDPAVLEGASICLLTVKARDTEAAGKQLAELLPRGAAVVSLQNGLRNAEVLRRVCGSHQVLAGMVTFNVVRDGPRFKKATSGPVMVEAAAPAAQLAPAFKAAGESFVQRKDIEAIQAGKLLLNLNNGVCAATGLSVLESVKDTDSRWVFAECIREGLIALRGVGRPVASIGVLSPALIERALRLPEFIFTRVARKMLTIDPAARSSTLQDLERGKPTEIDELNGEILRLAGQAGLAAPVNQVIVARVRERERHEGGPVTPATLRRQVEAACWARRR